MDMEFPLSAYRYLKQKESNARTYATTFDRVFSGGRGIHLWDTQGHTYFDCLSNAGALALGHNHVEVKEAVMKFVASDGLQQALDLSTPAKVDFVQRLFAGMPHQFRDAGRIHFCGPTGSDAVEAALKLARIHTQRVNVIAFHGAYHGMTSGALSAMGNLSPKSNVGLVGGNVHFAPYPYKFRCPFGTDGAETDQLSIAYLQTLLSDPECGIQKPAAVIVEVVQGEGGCIPASVNWLRALRALTCEFDVPLIVDEVQTGLGRTGTLFAIERAGITPDILVLSKAIGGGYPLSLIVYDRKFDHWSPGVHTGTFRGNQIAMVAGSETMRIIERDGLVERANKLGGSLMDGLFQIAQRFPVLGDVRGGGLMLGVEVINPETGGKPAPADGQLAKLIKLNCFRNGLIIETGGRHGSVLRFLPPLVVSESEIGEILDRFEAAVAAACLVRKNYGVVAAGMN